MSQANVGDDANVGLHQLGQCANLSRVIRANLEHAIIDVRLQASEVERRPDQVIGIALGFDDLKPLGKHGRDHFLGGRLATGTGHGNNAGGWGHESAVVRCEFVQCGEGVLHLEKREATRRVHCTGGMRDYRRACPQTRRIIQKIMTIKTRTA